MIHVMESDKNLCFGILFGRRLMGAAEAHGLLGNKQFGSRAEKTSSIPLLAKYSKYAIANMAKMNLASFDNDAKSCYDRIVMLLASLCAQRLGMDPKACELLLKTLDSIKYHMKTKHGISEGYYATEGNTKMHGPGQGGRASPGIWVMISCLLMECVTEHSTGITILSPDLLEIIRFYTNGFVDDVTLWIGDMVRSLQRHEPPEVILQEMKEAAQWWEQLLYATGGKLELQKCFYYLVFWEFNEEGEASLLAVSDYPSAVDIIDSGTGNEVQIDVKPSTEAHKTLGVMANPCLDNKAEHQRIYEKARGMGQIAGSASLSPYEAMITLNTRIYPAITYGLAIGTLTEFQLHRVQSMFVRPIIRSMGFNMNTPSQVVYGPKSMGGIGCMHGFAEQGRMKTQLLIQQGRIGSETGKLAIAMIKWGQLVAGVSQPILEETRTPLPHLTAEPYISTLREFLRLSRMGIHIRGLDPILPRRKNDRTIMDIAITRRPKMTKRTLERINRCRIFLKVESLADIVTADGKYIDILAFECDEAAVIRTDTLWPKQPHVGAIHKKTWQWFLSELCSYKSRDRKLIEPLGDWLREPNDVGWPVYYDEWSDCLLAKSQHHWAIYHITEKTTARWKARRTNARLTEQEVAETRCKIPVAFHYMGGGLEAIPPSGTCETWTGSKRTAAPKTWRAYVNRLPECTRDVLRNCGETDQHLKVSVLMSSLQDSETTVRIVVDGNSENARGTYAWVLAVNEVILWEGKGHARGQPMTNYRATAYGIISWMTFVRHYAIFYGVTIKCRVLSYCSDQKLMKRIKPGEDLRRIWESQQADYDVIAAIADEQMKLTEAAPKMQPCRFVKGGQSTKKKIELLNAVEYLKMEAEKRALLLLDQVVNTRRVSPTIPWPQCAVYLLSHNSPITSTENHRLRWQWRERELHAYLVKRWGTTRQRLDAIDWEAYESARGALTLGQRTFSTKLLIGWLATGSRLEKCGQEIPECPKCGELETNDHLLRCPNDKATRAAFIETFQTYLTSLKTKPDLVLLMAHGVRTWLDAEDGTTPLTFQFIQTAYDSLHQTQLGWTYFMRGILTREWREMQLEHIRRDKPRATQRTALLWSRRVSLWLIFAAQDIWTKRNEVAHAPAEPTCNSRAERLAIAQARDLYEQTDSVDHVAKDLFAVPIEERVTRPLRSLQAWIKSAMETTKASAARMKRNIVSTHRDIRTFSTRPTKEPENQVSAGTATNRPSEMSRQLNFLMGIIPTQQLPNQEPRAQRTGNHSRKNSTGHKATTATKARRKTKGSTCKHRTKRPNNESTNQRSTQTSQKLPTQQGISKYFTGNKKRNRDTDTAPMTHPIETTLHTAQQGIQNTAKIWRQSSLHIWNTTRIEREGGGSQAKTGRMRTNHN